MDIADWLRGHADWVAVEPGGEGGVAFGLPHVYGPALGVVFGNAFGARGVAEGRELDGFGADD